MNQHATAISNRLSLRQPQRESLEILDRVCDLIPLTKSPDLAAALAAVYEEFATVTDFERDFPSLCFALATGVGKTRLMGAFIAYLHLAKGMRHFFVLAPNLTIYNKLIQDFTPNTPKYVFQGIGAFAAQPPLIITGDNYEDGRGTRTGLFDVGEVHVNVFNISKINSEVRSGSAPRIRRLSEYIGQSYFDYLSKLDDLVLLMDESHRYRASAGVRAINELRPVLRLELTATPQVERGKDSIPFKNVVYSYPLSSALSDGFVKEPAVATRENFDAANYDADSLERLKLEDGVRIHENTKAELEIYAHNSGRPAVKPFMLVVAQDTAHANALVELLQSESFFGGAYAGKVITVHSGLQGEEKDDVVAQLLTVEQPDNPTEIVVHVNMLKEGWDVTNLYTIVPLRAANSRTLVEQSIGRGLRLPYGKRVGEPAVDRLTIVSHDRFQEIVDAANRPDSIIRCGIVIGRDIPSEARKVVTVESMAERVLCGPSPEGVGEETTPPLFDTEAKRTVARVTLQAIREQEKRPGAAELEQPEAQAALVSRVTEMLGPQQGILSGVGESVDVAAVVKETTATYVAMSIDIPRIIIVPAGEVVGRFADFDLDTSKLSRLQPAEQAILIQHLHDHNQFRLEDGSGVIPEERLEDYIVRGLIDFDDVSYDDNADLLYKLAGQVVAHLRTYLEGDDVANVLQYHQQKLVQLVHAQMQEHYVEQTAGFDVIVSKGFQTLRPSVVGIHRSERVRPFRQPVDDPQKIRGMIFGGFKHCLYPEQKFDSDSERRMAVALENDPTKPKWFRPSREDIRIHLDHGEGQYEPDFIAENAERKYIIEVKDASELDDPIVQAKARAGALWCARATEVSGSRWVYLLVPHNKITDATTLKGLEASYAVPVSAK